MTDPLAFALAVIAVLGMPGPTNTLLFTAGATDGFRAGRLIPAEIAGYLISILTLGLLIAPLIGAVPALGIALKLLAAAYLTVLAIRLWRHAPTLAHQAHGSSLIGFRHVFITTLLNPKALLFALGIIPLRDPHTLLYILAFCGLATIVSTCWIGLGTGLWRGLMSDRHKSLLPRIGATVILGFAGYLTWAAL